MPTTVRLLTPPRPGAVALLELAGEVDDVLASLTRQRPPRPGHVVRRDFADIDIGLVARWRDEVVYLMPHGGTRLVTRLVAALEQLGCRVVGEPADPSAAYPEAADAYEALMLAALPTLRSGAGLALLLDQPRRWRAWEAAIYSLEELRERARRLNRLLTPPLVALVGPVNAGKSTLTNALAGREASIAADLPGTTRDYVGAVVELAGLVVQWIDTPGRRGAPAAPGNVPRASFPGNVPRAGFRGTSCPSSDRCAGHPSPDAVEAEAQRLAAELVERADLVIAAVEAVDGAPAEDAPPRPADLLIQTKADLLHPVAAPPPPGVIRCSALTGAGLPELARAVRQRLLPQADLDWPGPWLFDERLIAAAEARP